MPLTFLLHSSELKLEFCPLTSTSYPHPCGCDQSDSSYLFLLAVPLIPGLFSHSIYHFWIVLAFPGGDVSVYLLPEASCSWLSALVLSLRTPIRWYRKARLRSLVPSLSLLMPIEAWFFQFLRDIVFKQSLLVSSSELSTKNTWCTDQAAKERACLSFLYIVSISPRSQWRAQYLTCSSDQMVPFWPSGTENNLISLTLLNLLFEISM